MYPFDCYMEGVFIFKFCVIGLAMPRRKDFSKEAIRSSVTFWFVHRIIASYAQGAGNKARKCSIVKATTMGGTAIRMCS
jgi:hypothetical protein